LKSAKPNIQYTTHKIQHEKDTNQRKFITLARLAYHARA